MPSRILLVDDEPRNIRVLEGVLFPLGYDLCRAENGQEALERVDQIRPDLILLDVMMPGLSGFEVCRQLKADPETQFIPIVLVTALSDRDSRVTGIESGADDFISKPVDPHELRARVLSLLRIKRLHDDLEARNRELERLERMRGTLTRMIIADFRSPDTGVLEHTRLVAGHLMSAMESESVVLFLRSPRDGTFRAVAKEGMPDHILGKQKLHPDGPLIRRLKGGGVCEVNKQDMSEDEVCTLGTIGSALLAPMKLKDQLLGVISLGARTSAGPYTPQDHAFLEAVAHQMAVGIDHVRLREQALEFDTAREIQRRLLPASMPAIHGYEVAGAWHPARAVSGDYFDVLPLSDRRFGLCIADVVGKGMPAALLMSNVQAAVKAVVSENLSPQALCEHVNRVIYSNIDVGKFVTFFYGVLDIADRRLTYTNAGHNGPILVREDGSQERLQTGGTVLGIFEEGLYHQDEIVLAANDRVVMYTDGITEMRNEAEEEFGEERLIHLVTTHRHLDAAALHRRVLEEVTGFGGEPQDDMTLLVLAAR